VPLSGGGGGFGFFYEKRPLPRRGGLEEKRGVVDCGEGTFKIQRGRRKVVFFYNRLNLDDKDHIRGEGKRGPLKREKG